MEHSFAVFACGDVGLSTIRIFRDRKSQLKFVLLDKSNLWDRNELILSELEDFPDTEICYYNGDDDELTQKCRGIDLVILAYWGMVIKEPLLSAPKYGFLNQHPSMLPYGAGKHAHVWSIIEESPFGATLMKINADLDKGDIVSQVTIEVSWEDTGKSLYYKGIKTQCKILEDKKEDIFSLSFETTPQKKGGSFHYGRELEAKSKIYLDEKYTARELLNILRAKTFEPFPGAYFEDGGKKYEVRVSIKEVKEEFKKENIDYSKIKIL